MTKTVKNRNISHWRVHDETAPRLSTTSRKYRYEFSTPFENNFTANSLLRCAFLATKIIGTRYTFLVLRYRERVQRFEHVRSGTRCIYLFPRSRRLTVTLPGTIPENDSWPRCRKMCNFKQRFKWNSNRTDSKDTREICFITLRSCHRCPTSHQCLQFATLVNPNDWEIVLRNTQLYRGTLLITENQMTRSGWWRTNRAAGNICKHQWK